jgi:hypothetical protein
MVAPLVGLGGARSRARCGVFARASLITDPTEDDMWRRLLYLVCTVEAALLAAILVTVVVEPEFVGVTVSRPMRQLCAVAALVLMTGCGYAVVCWLDGAVIAVRERLNL